MIGRARVSFSKPIRDRNVDERLKSKLEAMFGTGHEFLFFPSARSALFFGLCHLPVEYVVLPAFTCKAVLEAVLFANKKPVFADVGKTTCCMGHVQLQRIPLTARYAVLCTHQFGFPAPTEELIEMCNKTGAVLLEDCAASFGTMNKDISTGANGYFSIFSGDAFKMLPMISGIGMLMTKDKSLTEEIKKDNDFESKRVSKISKLKHFGKKSLLKAINRPVMYGLFYTVRYRFTARKTNDTPQLLSSIPYDYFTKVSRSQKEDFLTQIMLLPEYLEKRRAIASNYFAHLRNLKHVRILAEYSSVNDSLGLIRFPIFIENADKMEFHRKCARSGLDLGFVFSFPLPGSESSCPNSLELCKSVLNLPLYPGLTPSEVDRVISTIRRIDGEV